MFQSDLKYLRVACFYVSQMKQNSTSCVSAEQKSGKMKTASRIFLIQDAANILNKKFMQGHEKNYMASGI